MTTKKYRPYFSLSELEEISSALKSSTQSSPSQSKLQIAKYIDKYILEIRFGTRAPSYSTLPSMLERLELVDVSSSAPSDSISTLDPESCWAKWKQSPQSCTVPEIEKARAWAYENDKMTEQEEIEYEKEQGIN